MYSTLYLVDINNDLRVNVYLICKRLEHLIETPPFTRVIVLPLLKIKLFTMYLQPDDVIGKLQEVVPPGFLTNRDAFINSIPKDADFKPYGKLVHSLSVHKGTFTYTCH